MKTPENLSPYNSNEDKHKQVETMFDAIAPDYDFMNRLMSFRQDLRWRKKALIQLNRFSPKIVLDVAAGTGDFTLDTYKISRPDHITGIDLSEEMLRVARQKAADAGLTNLIQFEQQDCLSLTFKDGTFDAITVAFGVRNFENIAQGLREMYRVLMPDGVLIILELSRPERFPFNLFFKWYAGFFIPIAGRLFTKDWKAYRYLPASIQLVPQGKAMIDLLNNAGFKFIEYTPFTFGVCSFYLGVKKA
jgi:demethylmenaquinone methyltransferase / 2-methoxy-6-polyprenyl-1,4-benzoquinol methylase